MTNKKTNPIMTPEWLESLLSVDVVPEDKEAFMDYHRARRKHDAEYEIAAAIAVSRQSTAADPSEDWRHDPVLLAVSVLLQSLGRGNYEQARQETQTINRCLAMGQSPNPVLLSCMLRDLIG